jgi:signal transduction histidine kinase
MIDFGPSCPLPMGAGVTTIERRGRSSFDERQERVRVVTAAVQGTAGIRSDNETLQSVVATICDLADGVDTLRPMPTEELTAVERRAWARARTPIFRDHDRTEIAVAFAADALVALACDETAPPVGDVTSVVETVAGLTVSAPDAAAFALYSRALGNPQFLQISPSAAIRAHLQLLTALAPVEGASLWVEELPGALALLGATDDAASASFADVAASTIAGSLDLDWLSSTSRVHGQPVLRFGQPVAALVVAAAPDARGRASLFLAEAQAALAPVIERESLLERSASRDRKLQSAAERRLTRVGYDLHDGPLQEIAALAVDLRHAREQVAENVEGRLRSILLGRFDDLDGRLAEIDQGLRELSHSLESSRITEHPLEEVLRREIEAFEHRSGIPVEFAAEPLEQAITPSQRIALYRIVQEALSNIRTHSGATTVSVTVEQADRATTVRVKDDGAGFDVPAMMVAAAQRGRLGLVGMSERIKLLGGAFELRSRPGFGTEVVARLPWWEPIAGGAEA